MIALEKDFRFEAAHRLPNHDGKCRRLHGHSWRGTIRVEGAEGKIHKSGPKEGMLVDYADLAVALAAVVEELDHRDLNEVIKVPTSEQVAIYVYSRVDALLAPLRRTAVLAQVTVEETCTSRCIYRPGDSR